MKTLNVTVYADPKDADNAAEAGNAFSRGLREAENQVRKGVLEGAAYDEDGVVLAEWSQA